MNEIPLSQAYMNHLRAEHRQLHAEVRRIRNTFFAEAGQRNRTGELLQELSELSNELRRHFAEEEQGGCLEEAVCRCPSVAHEADGLLREHAGLLASLDQVIFRLKSDSKSEPPEDVETEFEGFANELLAHEAAENRVMQRGFGIMVNGESEE